MSKPYKVDIVQPESGSISPINGAFGSVYGDGSSMIVHFYHEYPTIQQSVSHPAKETDAGKVVDLSHTLESESPESDSTREVHASFFMTLETIERVHRWLGENIETLRSIRERNLTEKNHEQDV